MQDGRAHVIDWLKDLWKYCIANLACVVPAAAAIMLFALHSEWLADRNMALTVPSMSIQTLALLAPAAAGLVQAVFATQ